MAIIRKPYENPKKVLADTTVTISKQLFQELRQCASMCLADLKIVDGAEIAKGKTLDFYESIQQCEIALNKMPLTIDGYPLPDDAKPEDFDLPRVHANPGIGKERLKGYESLLALVRDLKFERGLIGDNSAYFGFYLVGVKEDVLLERPTRQFLVQLRRKLKEALVIIEEIMAKQ